jgi:hypothetical protein
MGMYNSPLQWPSDTPYLPTSMTLYEAKCMNNRKIISNNLDPSNAMGEQMPHQRICRETIFLSVAHILGNAMIRIMHIPTQRKVDLLRPVSYTG